jgi:hypothetical protein
MKSPQLVLAVVLTALFLAPVGASAGTTVYDDDWPGWNAAVGGVYITEDFNDATLNPELSVVSTFPGYISGGVWWDRLVYNTAPKTTTTWIFAVPVYAFGGTWNLGGPGGPGSNIEVLINGAWVSVGVINRSYINRFWGFVSDVPFTQVRLQAYNGEGWCETYELDNMVYSMLKQYLTGGGQIVAGEGKRKDQYVVSFSGNLGYAEDFSLRGQYQFHFHNVSVDGLDGAIFHSTSVSALAFYKDDGAGPEPPEAPTNVAKYAITGRLKLKGGTFEDGYTIFACVADRGEPGKNDSINFALWNGGLVYSSTWDFPHNSSVSKPSPTVTEFLAAGNLQIHAE